MTLAHLVKRYINKRTIGLLCLGITSSIYIRGLREIPAISADLSVASSSVKDVVIALEDRRFWYHPGIDVLSVGRVVYERTIYGIRGR